MNTGDIIRKLRNEKGISQEKLGEIVGVQKSAVAKYESGRVENLKRQTIEKLANFFEVTPSFLLGIESNDDEFDQYGINKRAMLDLLKDKPELLDTYRHITENENLSLLFDASQGLTPEDLEPVLILINGIRKSKGLE